MEETKQKPELMKMVGEQIGVMMRERGDQEKAEKLKNYKQLNEKAKKGQILFTGSSLMEQFPIYDIAANHGINKIIYNRGIGGYTTEEFLRDINVMLLDLKPSKVFINIGTNDINEELFGADWKEHLLTTYGKILEQIQTQLPETEVYMMAYYPVNATVADDTIKQFMLKTRTNDNVAMINGEVKKLAGKYGFHFIDANHGLLDDNGELKAEFTKEGVHMFANAYEVVYSNLEQYL